jgi:hypothetical protein
MSEEDYKESTTAIQGLIAGEEPDTKNLSNILSLRNQIYSFAIIEENIVKYHDKRTHDLFCFLKLAASHAEARKLTARYYLLRADICWNFHVCSVIVCGNDLYPFKPGF